MVDIEKSISEDEFISEQTRSLSSLSASILRPVESVKRLLKIPNLRCSQTPPQLSETAYLDGLRGFACLLVYIQHHNLWVHSGGRQLENGFGFEGKHFLATLPFIRIFFTGGHLAVTIFFVISGYVLSSKALRQIQAEQHQKVAETVASALFRRWIRLFLPVIATTFIYMTLWHILGISVSEKEKQSTYLAEVWEWYCDLKNFSFVFSPQEKIWFNYNGHLWSIPVEFKGSILIYTELLAFSRCTRNARLWCQLGLIWYLLYVVDGSHCAMFAAGMLLCDLDLLGQKDQLPAIFKSLKPMKNSILCHSLIVALYLGGVPAFKNDKEIFKKSFGWYWLSFLKPQAVYDYKWFYLFWASTIIVASVSHLRSVRRVFEKRFWQYLGRISYGFYLVHGPILHILGDRIYAAVGWKYEGNSANSATWADIMPLPKIGPKGLEFSFLLPQLILLPFTLWIADLVTRGIDRPTVRFAQHIYQKTLVPAPSLRP